MCVSLASVWVRVFNWLLFLFGFVFMGLSAYVTVKARSVFTYILLGLSGYILLVSMLGICTGRGIKVGTLYVIFNLLFILLQATVVVGFMFYREKTLEIIRKLDTTGTTSSTEVNKAEEFINNHSTAFTYGLFVWLGLQLVTLFFSAGCHAHIAKRRQKRLQGDVAISNEPLLSSALASDEWRASSTPVTNARREQMREKYGINFAPGGQDNVTGRSGAPAGSGRGSFRNGNGRDVEFSIV